MSRQELLERYRSLPLPTTEDEHWRFTDLKGFDPDAFVSNGKVPKDEPAEGSALRVGRPAPDVSMLDIETAGVAQVSPDGVEIQRAPEGITFEALDDHPRLGELVGATEKFAAHNAALWERGLLVVVPNGEQHLDYDTFQEHIAPNTTSDFAFKGALRDSATAVWRGMIRVERDAQKTNAYQENRNLMLSPSAHAVPIPGLEILANDVRCTHGATVGRVDREQLFYLMARGLSRSEAERLIVRGFFQDVLDRIDLEPVREALAEALEARIPQA